MKAIIVFGLLFFSFIVSAQVAKDSIARNYLEDQLYIGLQYNILINLPSGVSQNGFSGGLSFGFIKDIPLNEDRDLAIGIGIGYQYDVNIQNLKIVEIDNNAVFESVSDYKYNRFKIHSIEVPLELRWRNSTVTKYKFWRVYSGVKINYNFKFESEYKDDVITLKAKNINQFSKVNYGVFIAAGYSTWNLYLYYGLNPLFKNSYLNSDDIRMREMNIGLRFYIL